MAVSLAVVVLVKSFLFFISVPFSRFPRFCLSSRTASHCRIFISTQKNFHPHIRVHRRPCRLRVTNKLTEDMNHAFSGFSISIKYLSCLELLSTYNIIYYYYPSTIGAESGFAVASRVRALYTIMSFDHQLGQNTYA